VEAGAFFEGNCRHSDNPLADDAKGQTFQARPASTPPAPTPLSAPTLTAAPKANEPRPAPAASFAPMKTA
jgi:hypothetical protein